MGIDSVLAGHGRAPGLPAIDASDIHSINPDGHYCFFSFSAGAGAPKCRHRSSVPRRYLSAAICAFVRTMMDIFGSQPQVSLCIATRLPPDAMHAQKPEKPRRVVCDMSLISSRRHPRLVGNAPNPLNCNARHRKDICKGQAEARKNTKVLLTSKCTIF
jgi:hypothetical protein